MSFNPDLTLNAIVVNLIAMTDGRVPLTQGALAHAAFLDLVAAADPDLAGRLHESGMRQPFTISPLRDIPAGTGGASVPAHAGATTEGSPLRRGTGGASVPAHAGATTEGSPRLRRGTGGAFVLAHAGATTEGRPYVLRAGNRAALRLTLLAPDLFLAFLRRLLAAGPDLRLRIGDVTFAVESAIGAPGSHPWAGYTTAGELRQAAGTEQRIRMVFASPTAVSLGEKGAAKQRMVLIPIPQYVFASLRGAWNRLTGDEIPIGFEEWVADCVFVREVRNWQTAVYQLKRGVHPGGFGDVTFEALDPAPTFLRMLNLLADFAFYSGVGSKTTMGMGQVKRIA